MLVRVSNMLSSGIIFYILLFIIAFLYSTVGHGGASGYLALMAFFSFAPDTMRSSALILNLVVSGISFLYYYRSGHFNFSLFWPLAIVSIPAAYVGGFMQIDADLYKKILAVLLLFSVIRLLGIEFRSQTLTVTRNIYLSLVIGTLIGFLSGMIGIGGGILLSPLLLLLHWSDLKKTAAVSALFIFVNSLAGIFGMMSRGFEMEDTIIPLILIAVAGGSAGAYFGSRKFDVKILNLLLAVVLLIASLKLIFV